MTKRPYGDGNTHGYGRPFDDIDYADDIDEIEGTATGKKISGQTCVNSPLTHDICYSTISYGIGENP